MELGLSPEKAFGEVGTNHHFPLKIANLFTCYETISFLKWTALHGVQILLISYLVNALSAEEM
jgi:hypothetical protein